MAQKQVHEPTPTNNTTVVRKSDLEVVVTRTFDGPARIVFKAWTQPDLMRLWWVPKSSGMTLLSCEMDVRIGGTYRLVFKHPAVEQPLAFFGTYTDVKPNERLVWTNVETTDGAVSTLTLEENAGNTLLTLLERYPTKDACEGSLEGTQGGLPEQFKQLDGLLQKLLAN